MQKEGRRFEYFVDRYDIKLTLTKYTTFSYEMKLTRKRNTYN